MGILWFVLVFWAGVVAGFLFQGWLGYRRSYDGKIVVTHPGNRTLYSLELEDYPIRSNSKKR
jgi:hypothetical protein